jgi:hypothetical protein
MTIMWPETPYPGLRFYRESDAILFREREADIQQCERSLLRFGVKLLILQGVSGAGKSSFLRAGLIPHLRRHPELACVFLSNQDCAIRCTADPLPEIAKALLDALKNDALFDDDAAIPDEHEDAAADGDVVSARRLHDTIRTRALSALDGGRRQLALDLVDALRDVSSQLNGKLILILDQAEEVLTHCMDDPLRRDAASAFFYFLEELYLQNVDVRVIVSIRTEYYGRFRDELRISDDRLAERPRHGGVQPYLLRSLRDKDVLHRAMTAPTLATVPDPDKPGARRSVYNFSFQPGVLEEILDDVLRAYPAGAVTPALQIICAALYDGLSSRERVITARDFHRLGRLEGMMRAYIDEGVAGAAKVTRSQPDQWLSLLHSLVSRQGGGTLVSLSESIEELERRASLEGIKGDLRATFLELSRGSRPVLRGEPPEHPQSYSLQHDVLAAVLVRWKAQYETRKAERRSRNRVLAGLAIAFGVALFFVVQTQLRSADLLEAKRTLVAGRNKLATYAPKGNFGQSLLLSLNNLRAVEHADSLYERFGNSDAALASDTLSTLRGTLARMPALSGQARSAGIDLVNGKIAVLSQDSQSLAIYALPKDSQYRRLRPDATLALPVPPTGQRQNQLATAAGFVDGLGPVALVSGVAYYWNDRGERVARDVWNMLPEVIRGAVFPRFEFLSGKLIVSAGSFSTGDSYTLSTVYISASDLMTGTPLSTTRVINGLSRTSGPVFSLSDSMPATFAYLYDGGERPSSDSDDLVSRRFQRLVFPPGPSPRAGLDLNVARIDGNAEVQKLSLSRLTMASVPLQRQLVSLAFFSNQDALVFKGGDPSIIYRINIPALLDADPTTNPIFPIEFTPTEPSSPRDLSSKATGSDKESDKEKAKDDLRLVGGPNAWLGSPIAAVQIGNGSRTAWSAPRGIWVAQTDEKQPAQAHLLPGITGPLMSGATAGVRLFFSNDGSTLVLLQQRDFRSPLSLRIWDLRAQRIKWLQQAPSGDLEAMACALLGDTSFDESFSEPEALLYKVRDRQSVCGK